MPEPEQEQIENRATPGPEKGREKELVWGQPSKSVEKNVSTLIEPGTLIEPIPEAKQSAPESPSNASNEPEAPRLQLLSELIAEESRKNPLISPPRAIAERWEVQNKLGQGGMSTVYKARHLVMNKFVPSKS